MVERVHKDIHAFADLYDRYLPCVYRYLYAKTGAREEAEDLTSQVFLAALEAFPRYRHNGRVRTWLLAIARHKAADYYRSRVSLTPLEDDIDLPNPAQNPMAELIRTEELQRLRGLVSSLKEDERELLYLRFAAQLTFTEIAELLRCKESRIKMSLYRILKRMEKQLEAMDE